MNNIQSFSRYEFKFLLNKDKARLIENESQYFMKFDKNVNKNSDYKYFVRSLYFDDINSSNFYEKVDGMKIRKKYRLRTYSKINNSTNPIFLEMKGRINQRTYKNRTLINSSDLHIFFDKKKYVNLLDIYGKNNLVINNFLFDTYRKNIFPRVLIDYKRKPYINQNGLNFRLTFDTEIMSSKNNRLFDNNNLLFWEECKSGYTVLEVKFERSITPWFHRIIQNYNLKRMSISKFVMGVEQSKIAQETSR
ncbi:polyphosphate polymerase domain-containing protein [Candidatus Pelagibacter sp.]|nr:polyphosphate polymerase domain-containing protein [Candidatus Pelagibacter sp.]